STNSIFSDIATASISTLSLHDALPISQRRDVAVVATPAEHDVAVADHLVVGGVDVQPAAAGDPHGGPRVRRVDAAQLRAARCGRSEEHTSELQSRENLVCRLLLEKKKI